MEVLSVIASIGTLFIAFIGVWIAIAQLRSAQHDSRQSRMADMAWQIYQAYTDPKIRDARGAAEFISHTNNLLPNAGKEYGEKYADKEIIIIDPQEISYDTHMRRLLRFYNQVGILLEKELVDDDMVFALLGPGLKSAWPAISSAVDWYQNRSLYGQKDAGNINLIYSHVYKLYDHYMQWEQEATQINSGYLQKDTKVSATKSSKIKKQKRNRIF